eukprot:GHVR01091524.1.p1 GENE.GHVR01091524.1~~GHVR01091524.1.p1  ORF type:complete len:162 (-),score=38.89 GHVR01091524.1:270-755(-)
MVVDSATTLINEDKNIKNKPQLLKEINYEHLRVLLVRDIILGLKFVGAGEEIVVLPDMPTNPQEFDHLCHDTHTERERESIKTEGIDVIGVHGLPPLLSDINSKDKLKHMNERVGCFYADFILFLYLYIYIFYIIFIFMNIIYNSIYYLYFFLRLFTLKYY